MRAVDALAKRFLAVALTVIVVAALLPASSPDHAARSPVLPARPGSAVTALAQDLPMPEQTFGAHRVRLDHNPAGSPVVARIKRDGARFIDTIAELAHGDKRAQAIALTKAEEAAMWAVKAATEKAE